MVVIPLGSLLSPTNDFATFPRGDDLTDRIKFSLAFLLIDIVEWFTITYKCHWASTEQANKFKQWWYESMSWEELGKSKGNGMLRPLLFPWGCCFLLTLSYNITKVYTTVWDPLKEEAINERLQLRLTELLHFEDLRELCPP
jgi:hypothetical protein